MKPNLPLQARMLRLYQRFKQSQLTRAAFCREEGITAAQFTYWCRRFEQESTPADTSPPSITLAQVNTPIQAIKELVERESSTENQIAEPSPGFTQLHLPESSSNFAQLHLPEPATPTPSNLTVSPTPLMILDLAGKGRLEFYTPVEAGYLKALLS